MKDEERLKRIYCSIDYPSFGYPIPENKAGLVLLGGSLTPTNVINAYSEGIFPWFNKGEQVQWWSPDPRCVIYPNEIHISRKLIRILRKSAIKISFNNNFTHIIKNCAKSRKNQDGTWITKRMVDVYTKLHKDGWVHSIEVWSDKKIIGGLYGVIIGKIFFAESMYSDKTNASKYALFALCEVLNMHNFKLIDCQIESNHLFTLGATTIPKNQFIKITKNQCVDRRKFIEWPKSKIAINKLLKIKKIPHDDCKVLSI